MPRVPAIERTFDDVADVESTRRATRQAIEDGVSKDDVAESIIAFTKDLLRRGDTLNADTYIWHAVHDGVPPHALFFAVEQLTRRDG